MDDELAIVLEKRAQWEKVWRPELKLRTLMHRLQDPDVADSRPAPETEAEPVRILVDVPTRPQKLRDPLIELQGLDTAAQMIERAKEDIVAECRRRGRSWANVGDALGVTRQSAWMKYAADAEV